tara:strand:- start:19627 stop:20121 length:495 start_codon:yes stop_codon:yes gene_type:complete
MVSQSRRLYSAQRGKVSHNRFCAACEFNKRYETRNSSRNEDMFDHIDVWVKRRDGIEYGVDVKGGTTYDTVWVEFKNVRGDEGWLYGKASYIAFDMPEEGGFLVVPREELRVYAEANVSKEFVGKQDAYKKYYQRKDRQDVITKLNVSDIKGIKGFTLLRYHKE